MKRLIRPLSLLTLCASSTLSMAQAPTYSVETIATYQVTTNLTGSSGTGMVCGWQVINGMVRGFVASQETGIDVLPLPEGYASSTALDVNASGVIVGAVAQSGFPYDSGEPAIWTPDGAGSYSVTIPEQFETLSSPLGTLGVNGGMAVAINNAGTIIGWSRYQGFIGGPATEFSITGPPINLRELGFQATPEDLSETGVIAGNGLRMDLNTGVVTDLGLPNIPGGQNFTAVYAYAVNDNNQVIAAARRATSTADRWLTYIHDDTNGWRPLNPNQLPTPNVGFYDNNNLDDVAASGGVLFAEENVLVGGFGPLLAPEYNNWSVGLGFIADNRRVYTSGYDNASDTNAIVVLIPDSAPQCVGDTNADDTVNLADLNMVLANFGQMTDAGDTNDDGIVNLADLNTVLAAFGNNCN